MTNGEEKSIRGAKGRENSKEQKVLLVSPPKGEDRESQGGTQAPHPRKSPGHSFLLGTNFCNQCKEKQSFSCNRTMPLMDSVVLCENKQLP